MSLKTFKDLNIHKDVKDTLEKIGFEAMSPVQVRTIPEFLEKDVIVQSQTGSGKTLSYLVPVLNTIFKIHDQKTGSQNVNEQKMDDEQRKVTINALIIAPTRELCIQISDIANSFGIKSSIIIGGVPIEEDLNKLESEIVVGTPGRLLEITSENAKKFSRIKYLVLDESDKLLSLGFEQKLLKILECLPKNRITGLFSATIDDQVTRFCQSSLKNPVTIKIAEHLPENLHLKYLIAMPTQKFDALVRFIRNRKSIVFFGTCNCVNFYYEALLKLFVESACVDKVHNRNCGESLEENINGGQDGTEAIGPNVASVISAPANSTSRDSNASALKIYKIHGKMDQKDRNTVYADFEANGNILLCTDVAARGIDFKSVELVVHFDAPKDHANIVHRSGRTARMGMRGEAMVLLMPNERSFVNFLKLKGVEMEEVSLPSLAEVSNTEDHLNRDGYALSPHSILKSRMTESLLSLSVKAFVSYIRGYKEHILNYILNYKELDFDGLAELFCLERIPSMAELKNIKFRKYERKAPVENSKQKRIKKG
ncbi:uncharacterized protein VICG_01873 [Vittaforma corneae ATCC 50505]|uniref:ATP-dependent RNA helicase n=1 Tax=Vittaforma corneae (strain ATCC 50505) TaxID=993615 RepID=L2GKR7_VITCO|nr:uncharacterized protein VICG_01873 [Vittaforma corneae ATCC 50505]ELA41080.1 hypothetical protein VICG_01873 [Vittaforma corneae ATCC 50505]